MFGKALTYEPLWSTAATDAVAENQRWILSAMQKYGQDLVHMLWRILGNEQDVCDAYQNTFLQLAHYEGGRKPVYVKAYIFRVANNVAVSMLRRRIIEQKSFSHTAVVEKTSTPDEEFDSKQLQQALRNYITELPEHLRNVLLLRDMAEMSYTQTGRILGISAATARVYRCKAIRLLALWMNKER
jgi:RNA polymerase sigma factor (sigma-70 family)